MESHFEWRPSSSSWLPREPAAAVVPAVERMLDEAVSVCPICGQAVRRRDPRDLTADGLAHLACTGREIPPDPPPEGYEEAKAQGGAGTRKVPGRRGEATGGAMTAELAAAARDYAARGWPVFPLAGKVPRTAHGLKDASTDADRLRSWWALWPDAGVGVRTGRESGVLVLDVDGDVGSDSLHELEHAHGALPETVRVVTGGGGAHYYFTHPGGRYCNTAGAIGAGLDTRGDGGYVVAPPSPHPSGRRYEWDIAPEDRELAPPPKWLTETTRPAAAPRPASEWRKLAAEGAAPGQRNNRTAQLAGHLLGRDVDPFVTLELCVAWDECRNKPPLGREEITRTVASIARKEAKRWSR